MSMKKLALAAAAAVTMGWAVSMAASAAPTSTFGSQNGIGAQSPVEQVRHHCRRECHWRRGHRHCHRVCHRH